MPSANPATLTRKRFALAGRSHAFDPRIDAARGDLADIRLADRLFAPHYAAALTRTAIVRAPIRQSMAADAGAISEVLAGETFDVLEMSRGHAWGVCAVDGTVGYVPEAALGAPVEAARVVVVPHATPLDGGAALPMGSRVAAEARFAEGETRELSAPVADFVALAEALVGVPALAGGRSGDGVDATGLVFLTLSLAGIPAPRFADLQRARLGHDVSAEAPMLRGDLLFFADHAAIVADADEAIHVTADGVARAPIASIIGGGAHGPLLARRRLP